MTVRRRHTNHDTNFIRLESDHRATFPAMRRVSQRKHTQFDQSYPIWIFALLVAGLSGWKLNGSTPKSKRDKCSGGDREAGEWPMRTVSGQR